MKKEEFNEILAEGEEEVDLALELARQEKWEEALRQFDNAEKTFLSISHEHWLTFLRHEKVNCFHALGQLEQLDDLVELCIQGYINIKSLSGLSRFLTHLAQLYQAQTRDSKALSCLYSALSVAINEQVTDVLGPIYGNLAVQLLLHDEAFQAISYLNLALTCYSQEDLTDRSWLHEKLALAYQALYHHKEAESNFMLAIEGYNQVGQAALSREVAKELAELYQAGGQQAKATAIKSRLNGN
ncbi:MAG: hypothetical protein QNL04_01470 [SAR324 cluster bacterium]|nr:hypothetical protein [SAR324 cluster bacterium]